MRLGMVGLGKMGAKIAIASFALFPIAARAQSAPARDYLNTPVDAARFFMDIVSTSTETAPQSDLPLPNNEAVSGTFVATILYSYPLGDRYGGIGLSGGRTTVKVKGASGYLEATGFTDPAISIHANIFGAPALRADQFAKAIPQTSCGFHLTINAPLGS